MPRGTTGSARQNSIEKLFTGTLSGDQQKILTAIIYVILPIAFLILLILKQKQRFQEGGGR